VIQRLETRLSEAEDTLRQLNQTLTVSLIQEAGDELSSFGVLVNGLSETVMHARQELGPIIFTDYELNAEERQILEALGSRNAIDLTDLFVALRHAGQEIELRDLLTILEGMYRKNRVTVRIRQRGS
jgi:hypothetical protein